MSAPEDQPEAQPLTSDAERQALQAKLTEEHKFASLGRLSAGIIHEVNTPIGSLASNTEVLQKSIEKVKTLLQGTNAPPRALDLLETMGSLVAIDKIACDRITGIVRSMKTFARAGDQDIRKVDLNELLQSALKLSSCMYRRSVTVETDFGDLPGVECYPAQLGQVFLNLIVNASQAITGEGKIRIRTRLEGNRVHISIADTGHGIREEDRDRLFRTSFTTKAVGVGTGLGLSISREIVEDTHHGTISFESEVGVGTTFHVLLPVAQMSQQDAATS